MWINRKLYENMLLDNAKLREESRVLANQNITLQGTVQWFMVRMTQLEKERAVIMERYMGVTIETPNFVPAPVRVANARVVDQDIPAMVGAMDFSDMGDAEAARQGIGWDDNGNIQSK